MNEVAHRRKLCGQDDRASEIQSMLSVISSDAAPANEFYVSADVGHLDVVEEEMAGSGRIFHPHFEPIPATLTLMRLDSLENILPSLYRPPVCT